MAFAGLVAGRVVSYNPGEAERFKSARAAHIVAVGNRELGIVNLHVLLDGPNDLTVINGELANIVWREKVPFSEENVPYSWNWIPKE